MGHSLGSAVGRTVDTMYFNRVSPSTIHGSCLALRIEVLGNRSWWHQPAFVASFLQAVRSRVRGGEGTFVLHLGGFGSLACRPAWEGRSALIGRSRVPHWVMALEHEGYFWCG
jgi:hypothetical protein